jgi:Tol biopolymer transport system component
MNLWRVRVEERSGKVRGKPEPVTTPSAYCGYLSISGDGRLLCFTQLTRSSNIVQVGFDPSRETAVGQPVAITRGSGESAWPNLSPDGRWLAFGTFGRQEDLLLVKLDGTGLRQLTDDVHRDRVPRWSPDGKRIAFYSNRSGKYQIWTIRPDGSGLQQVTHETRGSAAEFAWSPDGARLVYIVPGVGCFVLELGKPWSEQSPQALPRIEEPDAVFLANSWSPDGKRLAGHRVTNSGLHSGIYLFSFDSGNFERLTDSGAFPWWMSDSHRILFKHGSSIQLLDSRSKRTRQILSVAPHELANVFSLSRDDRRIYFIQLNTEADVWLATLETR